MSNLQQTWNNLVADLTSQREQLITTIRNYPPPIPACDAQFNYLLEKRDRITVELHRLQKLKDNLTDEALQDFLAQSHFDSEVSTTS